MILNLIHRPATGRLRSMFDLQQQMAHSLGLKVTVLIPYDTMFEPDIVQGLLEDHSVTAMNWVYGSAKSQLIV